MIRVLKKQQFVFKGTRDYVFLKEHEICRRPTDQREVIDRLVRILIKHLKQGTQAAEPIGLIRAIWIIRVLKKSAVCV